MSENDDINTLVKLNDGLDAGKIGDGWLMTFEQIRRVPTELALEDVEKHLLSHVWLGSQPAGWHESLFRSYHILRKVRQMAEQGTPGNVLVEIIDDLWSKE